MTDLIRWDGPQAGDNYTGHAGAVDAHLFQIWAPVFEDEEYCLTSSLPGLRPGEALSYGATADELKPRAEELFRQWLASIGAVVPGPEIRTGES
jgi:hypothetical protein